MKFHFLPILSIAFLLANCGSTQTKNVEQQSTNSPEELPDSSASELTSGRAFKSYSTDPCQRIATSLKSDSIEAFNSLVDYPRIFSKATDSLPSQIRGVAETIEPELIKGLQQGLGDKWLAEDWVSYAGKDKNCLLWRTADDGVLAVEFYYEGIVDSSGSYSEFTIIDFNGTMQLEPVSEQFVDYYAYVFRGPPYVAPDQAVTSTSANLRFQNLKEFYRVIKLPAADLPQAFHSLDEEVKGLTLVASAVLSKLDSERPDHLALAETIRTAYPQHETSLAFLDLYGDQKDKKRLNQSFEALYHRYGYQVDLLLFEALCYDYMNDEKAIAQTLSKALAVDRGNEDTYWGIAELAVMVKDYNALITTFEMLESLLGYALDIEALKDLENYKPFFESAEYTNWAAGRS